MQFKRRDGLLSSIFGILTCGLYSIYFWFQYGEDVNVICADDGKVTQNYIVAWLLGIITCGIYSLYWIYNLASRLDSASKKYDVNVESPVLFTIFMNIPFLSYFYACDVMNKFQEKYEEMYPNGNGYYGNPYAQNPYGGSVPPRTPNNSGKTMQEMGAQIGAQLKSAVQDVGSSIKNTAQSAMPTCKNCGAPITPGKNYCKRCGYPVNGVQPQNNSQEPQEPQSAPSPQNPQSAPMSQNLQSEPSPRNVMLSQNVQETQAPPQPRTTLGQEEPMMQWDAPVSAVPQEREEQKQENVSSEPCSEPCCPKCGNKIKPGDRFCIYCGSKIG